MKRSTSRWTTAMALSALIALPAAARAQTPASPQTQPPNPATPSSASQATPGTPNSPAEHVRGAKQLVSSIDASTLPASARPKIAQLRTHLNTLEKEVPRSSSSPSGAAASSTPAKGAANWGTEVAAIDKILTDLIGPETGSAASSSSTSSGTAATGTAGRNATAIDDATKEKLREVRRHITELAAAMSGAPSTAGKGDASAAAASSPNANPTPSSPTANPTTPTPAPAPQPPAGAAAPAPAGQVDREAAKQHLGEARDSISQLAALPEAARLQGETRTQMSQLIAQFNELITTQNDWRSSYAKLEATLNALLGPDSGSTTGTAGAPGTTGTAGAAGSPAPAGTSGSATPLDPAIRAKLQEFRTHLKEFEQAAGGAPAAAAEPAPAATPTTMTPATPASPSSAPTPSPAPTTPSVAPAPTPSATPGVTGTTGTMSGATAAGAGANANAQKHLDAIDDILSKAKNGKLEKEQTEQIKMHLDQLRQLLKK